MNSTDVSGWEVMMVRLLRRLMDSITLSTSTDFSTSPSRENRPVSMSNTNRAAAAMTMSDRSRARPTSNPVYFFRIMAAMSVPPVEAFRLKRMPEPRAGRMMAKKASSILLVVRGAERGTRISKTWVSPA